MERDEEEKINQKKIEEQNILSEDEIINSLDMTTYQERIENIIGKQYSSLFFVYFENIYHSKIKNKISLALTEHLNKDNNMNITLWMHIYKAIKFYSKENLPIIIIKYFNLKAEHEFKFIYNESKKYTSSPHKFLDVYLRKMKKANQKKLTELKSSNHNMEVFNLYNTNKRQSTFLRTFLSKKTIMRPIRAPQVKNEYSMMPKEEEHSEASNKEIEIKNKKERRLQIIKQIHQLKINSIKEVEKANMLQNKQKKKYGGIKSRFLDAYNEQGRFLRIINSKSTRKLAHKNLYKNKLTDFEGVNLSTKRINNYSKISSKTALYLNTKENNYSSKKNLKLFFSDGIRDIYRDPYKENLLKKNLAKKRIKYDNILKKAKNLKELEYFRIDNIGNNRKLIFNKFKYNEYSKNKKYNSMGNRKNNKNNKKGEKNLEELETNYLIEKLDKKRNKEILKNLRLNNKENREYNNIVYNIFKRTQVF